MKKFVVTKRHHCDGSFIEAELIVALSPDDAVCRFCANNDSSVQRMQQLFSIQVTAINTTLK